ncbi:MAG: type VI secretion system baseplate subunit TssK [Prevotella sp.]|jgi:hypothetical protein|nr:type VI secretion system baseplate subunit TssK [Prevotella sp.]
MDINSRIDWRAGMEITAQTFRELDGNIDLRQEVIGRIAHAGLTGLLPNVPFCCHGAFVKNKFEIERLACMALLPSGRVLNMDEAVEISIPMLYGDKYYFTAGFGDGRTEFAKEGAPYNRPNYDYAIHSLEELEGSDLLPLMRFKVNEDVFSIDADYIPPCLLLESDSRFADFIGRFREKLSALAGHEHLEQGEGKRALQRYHYLLKDYDPKNSVSTFIQLTREIAQAIDYYIIAPNTETPVQIAVCSLYDVQAWLGWLEDYAGTAASILEKTEPKDHGMDLEALKAQLKAEIHEQLYPELYQNLHDKLKEELCREITEELRDRLTEYVNGPLKTELYEYLQGGLADTLYARLYDALYDALLNNAVFYAPVKEAEDEFTPVI